MVGGEPNGRLPPTLNVFFLSILYSLYYVSEKLFVPKPHKKFLRLKKTLKEREDLLEKRMLQQQSDKICDRSKFFDFPKKTNFCMKISEL